MPARPIAGYPSRTAACVALAALGASPREIGRRLGLYPGDVSTLLATSRGRAAAAAKAPPRPPRASEACRRTVPVERDVLALLEPDAARRGITVPQLVRRLLAAIAEDGLVDGVLDDADDPLPPRKEPA